MSFGAHLLRGLAGGWFATASVWAFANAPLGTTIENISLPMLSGGTHSLLSNATANVFIFFKPGQLYSQTSMAQVAVCEKELAGKSVHWVAIVSDRYPKAQVEAEIKETGIAMPVLIDVGDALYGKLGVALCPVTGIADKEHRLIAYQPFTKVNYAQVVRARIRHLLKEVTDQELAATLNPQQTARGSDPEVARRYLRSAEKHFQSGKPDLAAVNVKKALEKDPALVPAHVLYGRVLAAQGNRSAALKSFEQALQLEPDNPQAIAGKQACQEPPR